MDCLKLLKLSNNAHSKSTRNTIQPILSTEYKISGVTKIYKSVEIIDTQNKIHIKANERYCESLIFAIPAYTLAIARKLGDEENIIRVGLYPF